MSKKIIQLGVILEDVETGLRLMIVRPSNDLLAADDISYKGRKLTVCKIQPAGQPIEGIRVGMDPGSRSKPARES
ncbi:hypothetical protein [Citrobacter arsenatis]|uniref:Uncharacterized protein n=1 Tax=Citrobacter arsenatis TaxID=2546350 RepID=A0A4P6WJR0_9ENTR|nr:hypothetical protein [Citrobacter arsenatis]QBM22987.1 hypothetical protein E1B03_11325 [Citrobacter arsenatis]